MPNRGRIGGPDGAEHGTLIAIRHCEFRGRRVGGEDDGGFIPGGFDARAAAVAGFVAAGEEGHPCFWAGEGIGGCGCEDGLPVFFGEGCDGCAGGFGGGGSDGSGGGGGEVGFCNFEPGLEGFLGGLLGGG